MRCILMVLLSCLFVAPASLAQDTVSDASESARKTSFMMLNQSVCSDVSSMMTRTESTFAPIMNALRDEGAIEDWGLLTHAWGDEYNWNWYIVAENHQAWLDAWRQIVQRVQAADPQFMASVTASCTMHKDNLYTRYTWD